MSSFSLNFNVMMCLTTTVKAAAEKKEADTKAAAEKRDADGK